MLIMCLILFSTTIFAQKELNSSLNYTHAGRSLNVTYSKYLNEKQEVGGGIRYNINRFELPDDQSKAYYKRLYATKPSHYFGVQGFYHRYIYRNLEHLKPFLFYDFQATHSTLIRKTEDYPIKETMEGVMFRGPYWMLEQCVGLGFKVEIKNSLFLTQKAGAGYSVMIGYPYAQEGLRDKASEFGMLYTIGLGYQF